MSAEERSIPGAGNWADEIDELNREQIEQNLRKTFCASIWSRSSRVGTAGESFRPTRRTKENNERGAGGALNPPRAKA